MGINGQTVLAGSSTMYLSLSGCNRKSISGDRQMKTVKFTLVTLFVIACFSQPAYAAKKGSGFKGSNGSLGVAGSAEPNDIHGSAAPND